MTLGHLQRPDPIPDLAAEPAVAAAILRQTQLVEEIRDQFAEHLELQRQILRLLLAERG